MKFLIKKEWEGLLKKLSFNNNSLKETQIEKLFFEISQIIKELIAKKNPKGDFITYGIAMTFFHYYICFNEIRTIDRIEISFACFYLSLKTQFYFIPLKEIINDYNKYIKDKLGKEKNQNPDFIKYEIQLYSQLGYDLDIETPFQFFFTEFYFNSHINDKEKLKKIKNFCFNLIYDTYTRPLSIYFHPKIIYLSCLIFTLKFLEYNEIDIKKLIKDENLDLIGECMEKIYQIYYRFIQDNSNKDNNSINNNLNNNLNNNINNNNNDK